MFAVIFEVHPKPERWDDCLKYAKLLKQELENIDGFIDNERFASKRRDGWLVSLSIWRDEKALIRWRGAGLAGIRAERDAASGCPYHPRLRHVRAGGSAAILSPDLAGKRRRTMRAQVGPSAGSVESI